MSLKQLHIKVYQYLQSATSGLPLPAPDEGYYNGGGEQRPPWELHVKNVRGPLGFCTYCGDKNCLVSCPLPTTATTLQEFLCNRERLEERGGGR